MELVIVNNGVAVTTTLAIAEGTEIDHASVIKLARNYQSDLEEFGLLDFKSESTAGRPTEYANLNEQQATLLLTYMRNSDIVRTFKKRLVKAFYDLAKRPTPADPFLAHLDLTRQLYTKQQEHERRIKELEARTTTRDTDYFTIMGYGRLLGAMVTRHEASQLGCRAVKASAVLGYPVGEEYDARYGTVGTYHRNVLAAVFDA